MNRYIAVDFDGTLAKYEGMGGPYDLGEPIPKMVKRVKEWIAKGIEVRIFTARVSLSKNDRSLPEVVDAIEKWCEKHLGQKLKVTNEKDFGMIELWDDRAVRVKANMGEIDRFYGE